MARLASYLAWGAGWARERGASIVLQLAANGSRVSDALLTAFGRDIGPLRLSWAFRRVHREDMYQIFRGVCRWFASNAVTVALYRVRSP